MSDNEAAKRPGVDTAVWGKGMWDTLLVVLDAAERFPGLHTVAIGLLKLFTQTLPCEPCRTYYSYFLTHTLELLESRQVAPLDWLFALRQVVNAKLVGSQGGEAPVSAVFPTHFRPQLERRMYVNGHCVSGYTVAAQLLLQAVRVGLCPAEEQTFRSLCLLHIMYLLCDLYSESAPPLHRLWRKALRDVEDKVAPTWRMCAHAAYRVMATHPDAPTPLPPLDELVARIQETATVKLADWAMAQAEASLRFP